MTTLGGLSTARRGMYAAGGYESTRVALGEEAG